MRRTNWHHPPTAEERRAAPERLTRHPGLCADCAHLRLASSGRALFVRCARADREAGFPRYPVLPVLECAGFEAA